MTTRRSRPPLVAGVGVVAGVAVATALVEALERAAPVESLAVVHVPVVLLIASVWGGAAGYATAVLSAAAFNWFHLPPTGHFAISDSENWVALAVFLVSALVASRLAERARARAREADQRRSEADLATDLARQLLRGGGRLSDTLPTISPILADALGTSFAAIELGEVEPTGDTEVFGLSEAGRRIGTLLVAGPLTAERRALIEQRLVPSLEALLAAARERDDLLADVVETAALRRSDELKTALLRAVSHDLRTPITAIVTAGEALRTPRLSEAEHAELVDDIGTEAQRLSRLVDKVLDLGRLEADGVASRPISCSLPEVVEAAIEHLALPPRTFRLTLDADLPDIHADPGQLERAFANLLENAARFSGGHPVSVRGRRVGARVLIRIVDRGPGLPDARAGRIFEPFSRGDQQSGGGHGSGLGLGLAIVRGFVEANGGRVWAESVPRQGTTFVVEFPVPTASAPAPSASLASGRS